MRQLLVLAAALVATATTGVTTAQEEPSEEVLSLIIDFVKDQDRETRAIGLQQIREELPGEAVTKRLVELFPQLSDEAQVDLLGALGDRGDAAARPLVLTLLDNDNKTLRLAAIRAAGALGTASDVKLLADQAAGGSDEEKHAAAGALVRLRAQGVNETIVETMRDAEPNLRVALLDILTSRNAREALPQIKDAAAHADAEVRAAALRALRLMADKEDLPSLIEILMKATNDVERYASELALLAVCRRIGEASTDALIAGLGGSDAPTKLVLLRALARIGNQAARQQTMAMAKEAEPAVRLEAVRMLANWKDDSVIDALQEIAKTSENETHRVLALRGLVRIAAPRMDQPGNVDLLKQVLLTSKRIDEKRLALGALSGIPTVESLDLAAEGMQLPA